MNYVALLSACDDLRTEILHPDGFGHVQVEIPCYEDGLQTPRYLLEQIEQWQQWSAFFSMINTKPMLWLMQLYKHFPLDKAFTTECWVKIFTLRQEQALQCFLLSRADEWLWNDSNRQWQKVVLERIQTLLVQLENDKTNSGCDIDMLQQQMRHLTEQWQRLEAPKSEGFKFWVKIHRWLTCKRKSRTM